MLYTPVISIRCYWAYSFILIGLFISGPIAAQSDLNSNSPLEMIAQQEYRGAADSIASAPVPYDLQALSSKAVLLLYCGHAAEAGEVFAQLHAATPAAESLGDYGETLCALMQHHIPTAGKYLAKCIASPDYPQHRLQIDSLQAMLAAANGNPQAILTVPPSLNSPLAQEMSALHTLRIDPRGSEATAILRMPPWYSSDGLPRVTEESGLRATGLLELQQQGSLIEAPLAGSADGFAVAHRLLDGSSNSITHQGQLVQGTITLSPDAAHFDGSGVVATYYIDHSMAAVVNSGSLAYTWDTTKVFNGEHTVTIRISNPATGADRSESREYVVSNGASGAEVSTSGNSATPDAADASTISSAWDLLTLKPCYRIGEQVLAKVCIGHGDRLSGAVHFATAAALDFDKAGGGMQAVTNAFGGRLPTLFLSQGTQGIPKGRSPGIWRGNPGIREVALTFDDGPSPIDTPPLLAALEESSAPATFFVVGWRAEAAPDILKRMASDGDEVEDHSYTHPNLDQAIPPHIYEEILRNAVIVRAITGTWPHFLRPPGGQSNPHVLQSAAACGMTGAFWTIDALPAENTGSPAKVVDLVLQKIKPGAIVLMHNDMYSTTHAIPALVADLRARGYRLVTLLQLAKDALK